MNKPDINHHKVKNRTHPTDTILVVDDDTALLRLIQKNLKRAGFQTTGALNGTEAIAQVIEQPPILLLLDYHLPDMTGQQVIETLNERQNRIPFIITTGHSDERVAVEMIKLGARNCVVKKTGFLDLLIPVVQQIVEQLAIEKRLAETEKELRASEERFRLLYEQAPLGYQALNEDGYLMEVNQAWLDLLGYNRNEVIGEWFGDFLTPEYVDYFKKRFRRLKTAGEIHDVEFEMARKEETQLIVSFNGKIGFDEQGDFQQIHCTLYDITERKRIREELAQHATQLTLINDISSKIVTVLELDGVLTRAARLVQEMFDYHHVALFLIEGKALRLKAVAGSYQSCFPAGHRQHLVEGINGWVASHGEKVIANNVQTEPRYISLIPEHTVTRAELCLPIKAAGQTLGVLDIQSPYLDAFSQNDVVAMGILTDQIAVAIENARLYDEIHRRVDELDVLSKIGQAISSTLDLQKMLALITEHTTRLLGVAAASVALFDSDNGDLWFAAGAGEGSDFVQGKRLALGQGIVGLVVQHGESMLVPNVSKDPRFYAKFDRESGFTTRSILCAPLQIKGQTIGAIETMNKADEPFDQEDWRLLNSLAASAAIAIENARLYQQAQQEITERRQAEESLRQSERRYRSIYNNTPVMLHSIDKNGQIVRVSDYWLDTLGYQRSEVIGHMSTEFLTEESRRYAEEVILPEYFKTGFCKDVPYQFVKKNGEVIDVLLSAIAEKGKERNVGRSLAVLIDITERKQAEEALRENEERFRSVVETANDAIIAIDDRNRVISWNKGAEKMFGYSVNEAIGQPLTLIAPEQFRENHQSGRKQPALGEDLNTIGKTVELDGLKKDGNQFPLELSLATWQSGKETFFTCIIRDITERKQAEEERERLLAAEREQRLLVETLAEVTLALTSQINHEAVLDEILRQMQRLVPYNTANIMLLEDNVMRIAGWYGYQSFGIEGFMDNLTQPLTGFAIETEVVHSRQPAVIPNTYQEPRWVMVNETAWIKSFMVVPICLHDRVLGLLRLDADTPDQFSGKDAERLQPLANAAAIALENARLYDQARQELAERKRAEEEIRRRNRELTLLNRVIAASAAALGPEELLETVCRELALAFDVPQAAAALLNEEETVAVVVAEYRAKDRPAALGHIIPATDNPSFQYLLEHKKPLVVENAQSDPRLAPAVHDMMRQRGTASLLILPLIIKGEVVGSLGLDAIESRAFSVEEVNLAWSVADQAAGALARTRLTQTHQRLITAIEQTTESVVITDTKGAIIYVNPAFERVSGYSRTEAVGQNPRIINSGRQGPTFYQTLWGTIAAGQVWQGRFVNKKKDGTLYTEDATVTPILDEDGAIVNYVAVKRDVTHELQLEAQYHQAQKMEAIGRLASGVAHDFNNLLTAIMGHCGLALRAIPPGHSVHSDLEGIKQSAERAAGLTRQLLAFARKQVVRPIVLNLNELTLNLDKMLRRLIGEDIELVTLLAPDLAWIKTDAGQIEQVLLNLAINARDAMPDGGKLTIETANVTLDKDYFSRHTEVAPGEYVMLTISDTGIGMTDEVKAHMFEPFFTTKGIGKGTGLGLSTCFGIVKQSNGHIEVDSEPGRGATFKIYLPRSEEEAAVSLTRRAKDYNLPQGTETVLLVEDEMSVRELTVRTLRNQGYTVLEATNGEEALRVARGQVEQKIHLLLTDLIMPQLGGKELADQLKTESPDLKVMFMSGYTDSDAVRYQVLGSKVAFLQKPFSPITLIYEVRKVLDT